MRLRIDLDQETADALMKAAACDLRSAPSQAEFVLRREYGTLDLALGADRRDRHAERAATGGGAPW